MNRVAITLRVHLSVAAVKVMYYLKIGITAQVGSWSHFKFSNCPVVLMGL